MKSFQNKIVGQANYTLRDYYKDVLKSAEHGKTTAEEREAFDWLTVHDLCKCGHENQEHSKFTNGRFVACQSCDCTAFVSYSQ